MVLFLLLLLLVATTTADQQQQQQQLLQPLSVLADKLRLLYPRLACPTSLGGRGAGAHLLRSGGLAGRTTALEQHGSARRLLLLGQAEVLRGEDLVLCPEDYDAPRHLLEQILGSSEQNAVGTTWIIGKFQLLQSILQGLLGK